MTSVNTQEAGRWTLLTNHGRLLLLIAQEPGAKIRDLALAAGVTERTTQAIVSDLERAGYVSKQKVGRQNRYTVHHELPFRHPAEADHSVGELIEIFLAMTKNQANRK
jgi:DNA-binding MarR family transcriptional regulator